MLSVFHFNIIYFLVCVQSVVYIAENTPLSLQSVDLYFDYPILLIPQNEAVSPGEC